MTRIEYDLLKESRPDLELPNYVMLWDPWRKIIADLTREEVIARRSFYLLTTDIAHRSEMWHGSQWMLWL